MGWRWSPGPVEPDRHRLVRDLDRGPARQLPAEPAERGRARVPAAAVLHEADGELRGLAEGAAPGGGGRARPPSRRHRGGRRGARAGAADASEDMLGRNRPGRPRIPATRGAPARAPLAAIACPTVGPSGGRPAPSAARSLATGGSRCYSPRRWPGRTGGSRRRAAARAPRGGRSPDGARGGARAARGPVRGRGGARGGGGGARVARARPGRRRRRGRSGSALALALAVWTARGG